MALVVRNAMNLTPTGPAVNIMFFEDFLKNPPDFFSMTGNTLHHDPDRVILCDRSKERAAYFPDTLGGCLKVSTEDELANLTHKLLNLPIVFTVDMLRGLKSGNVGIIHNEAVAVIVNPQHEYIQNHMKGLLAEAMECMKEGKDFAVEFDFNDMMQDWLRSVFIMKGVLGSEHARYISKHGKFTVTSCGEFREVFSCKCAASGSASSFLWILCLPFCLVTCPIYNLHRCLKVTDLGGPIVGVTATEFQPYKLEDVTSVALTLHYQQQVTEAVLSQPPQPSGPPVFYAPPQPINNPPPYEPSVPQKGNIN